MNGRDYPVVLSVGSFFGFLREWIGLERLLYTLHDDPTLVEDMMDTMLNLEGGYGFFLGVYVLQVGLAGIPGDVPQVYDAQVSQDYRPSSRERHRFIFVDSDSNVEELIPLWLEVDINYIWPLEVAAGNNAVALRRKYGKNVILGGAIDKRALIKGKEAIREEVMSKVPFLLEQGGYFPSVDHLVPPDVTFENY